MSNILDGLNIQIYTRSCNDQLFQMSGKTIDLPYPKKKLKFTTGGGYFYEIMKTSDADIVINIDEDAFITDNDELKSLLEYFVENKYVNCGVADGGVIPVRVHNPISINPFFNIMDLRVLRKEFSLDTMQKFEKFDPELKKLTNTEQMKSKYEYDMYEPYYPFFMWIRKNYKVLDMNATTLDDGFTTVLMSQNNKPLLYHTWWSRSYGLDSYHTERINGIIKQCGVDPSNYKIDKWENFENKVIFRWMKRYWKVMHFLKLRKYV